MLFIFNKLNYIELTLFRTLLFENLLFWRIIWCFNLYIKKFM